MLEGDSAGFHQRERLIGQPIKCPDDFVVDLIECNKAVCCDCDGSMACCKSSRKPGESKSLGNELHCSKHCSARRKEKDVNGASSSEGESSNDPNDSQGLDEKGNLCQTVHVTESNSFPVTTRIAANGGGWLWTVGIEGKKDNLVEPSVSSSEIDLDSANNNPMKSVLSTLTGWRLIYQYF